MILDYGFGTMTATTSFGKICLIFKLQKWRLFERKVISVSDDKFGLLDPLLHHLYDQYYKKQKNLSFKLCLDYWKKFQSD